MSTPSTAVATPIHNQYGHSQHYPNYHVHQSQNNLMTTSAYPQASSTTTTISSNTQQLQYQQTYSTYPSLPRSITANTVKQSANPREDSDPVYSLSKTTKMPSSSSARDKRPPDWKEFYKNGPPKEIIVIDDTPPPESNGSVKSAAAYPVVNGQSSKRRRTDAGNTSRIQESDQNTPTYLNSATISLDRTTSVHTTAPTSLGSHGSANSIGYNDTQATTGQKRKRATRQTTGADKKKQETDAYNAYVPPRRPPIKASDVQVRVIREGSLRGVKIDDDDGHYIVKENSPIGDRYQITKLLGQGTFGKVVEAWDRKKSTKCAIKVIRSVQKYRDASKIELRVLSTLAQNDAENRNKCIHLRDCFDFRNHICIVTDLLGQSVFDFLKANSFVPFPSSHIQSFARQLLTSVAFLHDLNLIHTDLKPENILLVSNSYQTFTYNKNIPASSTANQRIAKQRRVLLDTDIRLIDFGSATFDDEYHSTVVSTRHYRAPEIILQLGWSYPCDIWSIGCILVEFFTGDALFQTHDNLEHLAMMEVVCAKKIDPKIVRAVQHRSNNHNNSASKYFKQTKLAYPTEDTSKASRSYVKAMKRLEDIIPVHPQNPFNKLFLDLLKQIFVYDPNARITAKEALKHPWFSASLTDDGTEAARIRRERMAAAAEAAAVIHTNGR